jgi:hypothetical protein
VVSSLPTRGMGLRNYPFDVLLGSAHRIGAWLFDALEWSKP